MNSFKTELFRFSFDANDTKQIVHIERTHFADPDIESFFRLSMFTDRVCDLIEQGRLSKSEGLKAITKAAKWFLA
jgi:competence transcription factor ComK